MTARLSSSTAGLAAGFTQWIAGIFFPMCAATILVLLIGGARWLLSRQLVGGQFPMSADRPGPPAARGPRPDVDPWADQNAARSRPAPRPGSAPVARPTAPGPPARPATTATLERSPALGRPARGRPAHGRRPPSAQPERPAGRPAARVPSPPGQPGVRPGRATAAPRPPAPQRPARPPRDPWDQR